MEADGAVCDRLSDNMGGGIQTSLWVAGFGELMVAGLRVSSGWRDLGRLVGGEI
jgi:hypothetical protein